MAKKIVCPDCGAELVITKGAGGKFKKKWRSKGEGKKTGDDEKALTDKIFEWLSGEEDEYEEEEED